MKLGDIVYKGFVNEKYRPWVCACKVIALSKKGMVGTAQQLDSLDKKIFKVSKQVFPSYAKTPGEALHQLQRHMLTYNRWDKDLRIKIINEAQKKIDKWSFCPSI